MSLAAFFLATAPVAAGAPSEREPARGPQVVQVQAAAQIVERAALRQATGLERSPDAPKPQITRVRGTVFYVFQ